MEWDLRLMGRTLREYQLPLYVVGRQPAGIEIAMDGNGSHFLTTSQADSAFMFNVCCYYSFEVFDASDRLRMQHGSSVPEMPLLCGLGPVVSVDWYIYFSFMRSQLSMCGRRCTHRNTVALACGNAVRLLSLRPRQAKS